MVGGGTEFLPYRLPGTSPIVLYLILHFGCTATEQQLASGRIMKCSDEKLPGSWQTAAIKLVWH